MPEAEAVPASEGAAGRWPRRIGMMAVDPVAPRTPTRRPSARAAGARPATSGRQQAGGQRQREREREREAPARSPLAAGRGGARKEIQIRGRTSSEATDRPAARRPAREAAGPMKRAKSALIAKREELPPLGQRQRLPDMLPGHPGFPGSLGLLRDVDRPTPATGRGRADRRESSRGSAEARTRWS